MTMQVSALTTSASDELILTTDNSQTYRLPIPWLIAWLMRDTKFRDVSRHWTDGANFHIPTILAIGPYTALMCGESVRLTHEASKTQFTFSATALLYALDSTLYVDPVSQFPREAWGAWFQPACVSFQGIRHQQSESWQRLITFLLRDGAIVIKDTPSDPAAFIELANAIGQIQATHLGDFFELRTTSQPNHIGEVNAYIPPHIDLVYYQNPPEYQMLQCIEPIATGGENVLIDGQSLIERLDGDTRRILEEHIFEFVAKSEEVHYRGAHPIIKVGDDNRLAAIFYNEYKILVKSTTPCEAVCAVEELRSLVERRDLQCEIRLQRGDTLLFDNTRVIHGRRSFDDHRRHVRGGFLVGDQVRNRMRLHLEGPRLS
jgi:alpha-ketoglutarate-dependent taurine dioxygenase